MTASSTTAVIRDARPEDLPRLLQLLLQLSELSHIRETEPRPVTDAHRAVLDRITHDPDVRLVVLEDGGQVIGTLTLYVMANLSHGGRPFAIVENVVVDAEARGGGYGRQLMAFGVRTAREAGCYKVGLSSNNQRPEAHAFYRAIGFQDTHHGFAYYFDDQAEAEPMR